MREDYIRITPDDADGDPGGEPPRSRERRRVEREPASPDQLPFEDTGGEPAAATGGPKLPFDPLRLAEAVARRWWLWLGTGLLLGAAAFAYVLSHTKTVATMQLIRRDPPVVVHVGDPGDAFKPHQFSDAALTTVIRSPEIIRLVAEHAGNGIPASSLGATLGANPDDNSELVNLVYAGPLKPAQVVNILNTYGDEIIKATQALQTREGKETAKFLASKVDAANASIDALRQQIAVIPPDQKIIDPDQSVAACMIQLQDLEVKCDLARIELEAANPVAEKLQAARDQLVALQTRYTDEHPAVQDQKEAIRALEEELAAQGKNPLTTKTGAISALVNKQNNSLARQLEEYETLRDRAKARLAALSNTNLSYALLKNRLDVLQQMRTTLASRQREAEVYAADATGYYEVFRPASLTNATVKSNWRKAIIGAVGGGLFGAFAVAALLMLVEVVDPRLKTAGDVTRVTGLPVLATLGDISEMTEEEKRAWAFRTWTIIKGKITASQTHSLVCGLISACPGEGRSTWVNLLAQTAFDRGMRVVVAEPSASSEPPVHPHEVAVPQLTDGAAEPDPNAIAIPVNQSKSALAQNGFKFPVDAAHHLASDGPSLVHIPLPGWAWNLECRNEWRDGLAEWEKIENMVFLIELPPATCPEAVLLAENLPQLIWLSKSGVSGAVETKKHLETLRHAGCNLVGAALNCEKSWLRHKFGHWLGAFILILGLSSAAHGQDVNQNDPAAASSPNASPTSAVYGPQPAQRASWQQRLLLGPGDVLTFHFYGETNLTKENVAIGMDGRIGYLQAHDVEAAGLTVDELRERLNHELGAYYRTPRVMITPVAYRSKKYFVLGKVTAPGAYVLDRPVTIVEALARAKGLASGLVDRNSIDLADLGRSFLIRAGQRYPVDFERLFGDGDFSQNLQLEPSDFLYFAPANLKEIYVLGQVRNPGAVSYAPNKTVIGALAERGGFTDTAWKQRVLVVRGSLSHPTVYAVDTWTVLDARARDFRLEPHDIVYVSNRPFFYAEELTDVAITAFLQSAVTDWSAAYITLFDRPFFPHP